MAIFLLLGSVFRLAGSLEGPACLVVLVLGFLIAGIVAALRANAD